MWPGQRTTIGTRIPPSQVVSLLALKGVMPPSGKVWLSAPLSVVKAMMVLSSSPISSSFFSTKPMLSSICFMPASLMPQSLPPSTPSIARYFGDSIVVICMRAGLYQMKNGLLVFSGSLRSRKSMTLAEISSSTVFERSSVSGPSSLHVWFADVPSEDLHERTGRGGVRQVVVFGSTAPGTSGRPGIGCVLARRRETLLSWTRVNVGEAHLLHCVQVVEIAPELLETVRRRQRIGMVAQVVLAELAGVIAKVEQELGERGRAGPQI